MEKESTVTVPGAIVDLSNIVALPSIGSFVVVPISVPSPVTLNVIELVAVVTGLLSASDIVAVIIEVEVPDGTPLTYGAIRPYLPPAAQE